MTLTKGTDKANNSNENNLSIQATLLGYLDNKIIPVSVKKIKFIYSGNNEFPFDARESTIYAHTLTGKNIILRNSLDYLQNCIDPELFFRANRQFIINRKWIEYLEPYFNRRLIIRLTVATPEKIIVSKTRVPVLINWLKQY